MSLKNILVRGIIVVFAISIIQGCSNNFVPASQPTFGSTQQGPDYFPLNEGFQTTFEISSANGSAVQITYTVGKEVPFLGRLATEWIKIENGTKDTSYLVLNSSSLEFYESRNSSPEVILDLPLAVGKTWSRFEINDSQLNDTSAGNGGIVVKDGTDGPDLAVSILNEGYATMMVDKIESLELGRAGYHSGVYRVSNDAGSNTRNYYWYAAGLGLIKFMHGATNSQNPSGGVTGELVSYGYKY